MFKLLRAGSAAAVVVALGLVAPAAAHAEPSAKASAPTDEISGALVQIKTVVTGAVYVKFDEPGTVYGWSSPITKEFLCTGVAVEKDRIVTSASCTDPKSFAIASEFRKKATEEILIRDGRTPSVAEMVSNIGAGQKWDVVASAEKPDQPAQVAISVRGLGEQSSVTTATMEASTFATDQLSGPVALLKAGTEIGGIKPAIFAEEQSALGSTVFVAAPGSNRFDGPAPKPVLRESEIASIPVDNGHPELKLTGESKPQELGAPLVDADGVVVGLLPYSESTTAVDGARLYGWLASKGVTFAEPEPEKKPLSIWVWLGPVIGVVALLVIGGIVWFVVRGRRKRRAQSGAGAPQPGWMPNQQLPGQQFPSQPFLAQQYPGQQNAWPADAWPAGAGAAVSRSAGAGAAVRCAPAALRQQPGTARSAAVERPDGAEHAAPAAGTAAARNPAAAERRAAAEHRTVRQSTAGVDSAVAALRSRTETE
ncbi:MAG: hypothetical protein QM809_08745 [Gordonia sp. (in: high G+C Gram-positive bacteria)]|uniref:trypsin-like peptidase domain-containing protein n=1 Tax=Gordonia sp. (in: high G+C Gram-positive bacteria) TaxID=84139 RepID=UPI0039E3AD84